MSVPVGEAVSALSTFTLEDDQPDIQGLAVTLLNGWVATESPIDYDDVQAYQLSLLDDTKSITQLNNLIKEGRDMVAILYTYRSCVKALPQLPESMKQSQTDLYRETYQVLDLEIGRLREIKRWQNTASSKLAADMQRFSRPDRRINGPTVTHMWCMLKLLDVLLQLDHLKNAKASIPNDFSWYKRTFTQVSTEWADSDSMREELDDLQIFLSTRWIILLNLQVELFRVNNVEDILQVLMLFCLESLESDRVLLYSERHVLLRVLPVVVILATSSVKEGDQVFKRIKINRLIRIFRRDPVVPAFPDLHIAPASMLKELSPYFRRFAAQMNQLQLMKLAKEADDITTTQVKEDMYMVIVEGFQLLSEWTGRVWEQCAWKFSRPSKDAQPYDNNTPLTDYEKVVRCNYSIVERKALLELTSYIKGVGTMMEKVDTIVAETIWETVHAQVQDFVQNKLAVMLRTTFKKKKDISRILTNMRTISADWMGNASNEPAAGNKKVKEDTTPVAFRPRPAAPTAAQLHCLQFLIHELVSGGAPKKAGGFFGSSDTDIPSADMKLLENFFNRLAFFPHILDYRATLIHVSDLGFLWFREFYLETSKVIQFPIECSLPWMLADHIIESQDAGLLESVLMPFDVYNDSAEHALRVLKQRFLYDEIEAEVDLCFDQLVYKLSEHMFSYYKSCAASKILDLAFISAVENRDKYNIFPRRYESLFKMRHFKLLGRSIDLSFLLAQRMNKILRENLEFLLERFESQDICHVVELQRLVDILKATHELLSEHLTLDSFTLILSEVMENISLVSFSGRLASQIFQEVQNDLLPNFILCNTTQRFVRSIKSCQRPIRRPAIPHVKSSFMCGSHDLNTAHSAISELYSKFFGLPHMFAILKLLGSRSIPWLVRALLDHLSQKLTSLEGRIDELRGVLPKVISIPAPTLGVTGCLKIYKDQLHWATEYEHKVEVLQNLKEIGSLIFWMSLLDTAMRETETVHFMQVVPWLGVVPGSEAQMQQLLDDDGHSPLVSLFKSASAAVAADPETVNPQSFVTMSKQAEVADILYVNNLQTGSTLDYTLAYLSAILDTVRGKWNSPSKTGLIEITTSREFHRIYSGIQFVFCGEQLDENETNQEQFGDAVAWGGCTVAYLLGQHLRFELLDFSYHVLTVGESEVNPGAHSIPDKISKTYNISAELVRFLESARKARRLNSHVFTMLRARFPHEDKLAALVKQSGTVVHRIKYPSTPSAFDTLPAKGNV
ncbi:hypothetical protein Mp_5g00460 [Marchantia polymorpha subsp. ruderalis]|uniref:CYRIA/CYRIB Rac1 binding domain-containing protein n=4 Tax=Marchantia polymorpha TaxID=3197 RepID=A0AAF6BDG3_MARPO|nr:hypothetical protein MARPO_0078s0045 [Marchantia polymorpha]BBN10047.1 hypothetical protein Mp_5g00460 [Marchantia polymorpha subsp. ruderalis]|eukprot:PTQ34640.1 hypothetical protein MARPO_0078s0045 [Marchantia polymorpha]